MENDIIRPEEYDYFVQNVQKSQVCDIGTNHWLELHEILLKLNQQAILEASAFREELVKELLVSNDKIEVLIHEAYCVMVWRSKILPKLLTIESNPNSTFILYAVLYHEAIAISLLETVLYHEDGCTALNDCALDLIDYCAQGITQLIGLVHINHFREHLSASTLATESAIDELERQKKDFLYKIGIRCLTILSYIADKIDVLPLSVVRRLVQTHDVPCLLSEILHCQPWQRCTNGIEKYLDDKWTPISGEDVNKITKTEAQTWFCLRQLLFNANAMSMYEINEFRQREISKCQIYMTVNLLDQLPPLSDLKRRLCTLALSESKSKSNHIVLEEMPKIRDQIMEEVRKIGDTEIARKQAEIFFDLDHERITSMAKRLNDIYNIDLLEKISDENTYGNFN